MVLISIQEQERPKKRNGWNAVVRFDKKVRARNAATSIITYGEALFKQVFAKNAKVLVAYRTAVQSGMNDVQMEVAGSPRFTDYTGRR